ncbi:hypothetical protein L218DRAFT_1019496 [Marasmius fiardii PR-910]|nr:hypothetical protein L218DRAFT_1019496 [Marasmius fiardii PR-910]
MRCFGFWESRKIHRLRAALKDMIISDFWPKTQFKLKALLSTLNKVRESGDRITARSPVYAQREIGGASESSNWSGNDETNRNLEDFPRTLFKIKEITESSVQKKSSRVVNRNKDEEDILDYKEKLNHAATLFKIGSTVDLSRVLLRAENNTQPDRALHTHTPDTDSVLRSAKYHRDLIPYEREVKVSSSGLGPLPSQPQRSPHPSPSSSMHGSPSTPPNGMNTMFAGNMNGTISKSTFNNVVGNQTNYNDNSRSVWGKLASTYRAHSSSIHTPSNGMNVMFAGNMNGTISISTFNNVVGDQTNYNDNSRSVWDGRLIDPDDEFE